MKYLIEIGSTVKSILLEDNYVVSYEDYPFSKDVLSKIYKAASGIEIDCLIFVMNSFLSLEANPEDYVAYAKKIGGKNYYASFNKGDVHLLLTLAELLNAKDVRIFDKFGFYHEISKEGDVVIDNYENRFIIYARNKECGLVEYASSSSVTQSLANVMRNTSNTNVINASSEFNKTLLKYYANLDAIQERILHKIAPTLAVFSCALQNTKYDLPTMKTTQSASENAEIPDINEITAEQVSVGDKENELLISEIEDDLVEQVNPLESLMGATDLAEEELLSKEDVNGVDDTIIMPEQDKQESDLEEESMEEEKGTIFEDSVVPEDDNPTFIIKEMQPEGDTKKKKKHSKGRGKLVGCIAYTVLGLGMAALLYASSMVQLKQITNLDKEIAYKRLEISRLSSNASKVNYSMFNNEDASLIKALADLEINGYVGQVSRTDDGHYSILVYLYEQIDINNVVTDLKEISGYESSNLVEAGTLEVNAGMLYKYKITLE